ncbi:hypothetical protein OB920_14775 [Halobacteria archaeon HArc-gm2]|nr:hypothetical protein [Halobacteria archaeon HArc-gm2]
MSNTVPTDSDVRSVATDESSVDELFDVLTTERRRRVLSIMGGYDSPVPVERLAQDVAAQEADVAAMTVPESTVRDVHVSLHHRHLPKLDDAGLLDYDHDDRTVAPTTATDGVPIDIE